MRVCGPHTTDCPMHTAHCISANADCAVLNADSSVRCILRPALQWHLARTLQTSAVRNALRCRASVILVLDAAGAQFDTRTIIIILPANSSSNVRVPLVWASRLGSLF